MGKNTVWVVVLGKADKEESCFVLVYKYNHESKNILRDCFPTFPFIEAVVYWNHSNINWVLLWQSTSLQNEIYIQQIDLFWSRIDDNDVHMYKKKKKTSNLTMFIPIIYAMIRFPEIKCCLFIPQYQKPDGAMEGREF